LNDFSTTDCHEDALHERPKLKDFLQTGADHVALMTDTKFSVGQI